MSDIKRVGYNPYFHTRITDYHDWLRDFQYRIPVVFTGGSSGMKTGTQLKLTVPYNTSMLSNFDDLRFTGQDGVTLIDAWLEDKTDGNTADIYVELPITPSTGDKLTYYMYFGQKGISNYWNGAATFLSFFDGDPTGWTEVDPNSHIAFANNRLEWSNLDRDEDAYVYQASEINGDIIIEYTFEITGFTDTGFSILGNISDIIDDYNNVNNGIKSFSAYFRVAGIDIGAVGKRIADVETSGSEIIYNQNTQYWVTTIIDRSGNANTKLYSDSSRTSQIGSDSTVNVSDVSATMLYMYLLSSLNTAQGGKEISGWLDDFTVRKYVSGPPTYSFGAKQRY